MAEEAPHAEAPPAQTPDEQLSTPRRYFRKVLNAMDRVVTSKPVRILTLAFGLVGFIFLLLHIGKTNENVNDVKHLLTDHINATIALAQFFEVLHITNDLHSKDVQCLTLLAECEDLSLSGLDQGMNAQLKRLCSNVVARCERMVKNHLERLAELTFDAGSCITLSPTAQFCYPDQEVTSADTLHGLRYDRVGPSSALFGPSSTAQEQSMMNRQEYGVFMAYSFFKAPGAGSVHDGIAYVSLNATSPAFGRPTVRLETPDRGWIHSFYADHERVLALGLDSNKIYHWDVSASLSLAPAGTTITGTDMATGTSTASGSLSRPWSVRRLANGDYVVSMLDNTGATCAGNAQLCGGLMLLSASSMATNPGAAPSRFDDVLDPFLITRHTPGECAVLGGGRDTVACGAFGSYDNVLSQRCLDAATDIFGTPAWGSQINTYTTSGETTQQSDLVPMLLTDLTPVYAPRPPFDWSNDVGGYIPNRIVQFHNRDDQFLAVDTFGGAVIGMAWTGSGPSAIWSGAVVGWILPIGGDPTNPGDATSYTTPLLTDAILSPDDCMLFLASPALGQLRAYSLCETDPHGMTSPRLCSTHQLTGGLTDSSTYVHASNPSRPLYGGPTNLAITPDGEFLYASSSSVFDDCLFPDAITAGGFMVRYKVSAARCDSLSIDIDPGFFVDGNALPGMAGIPARLGTIGFASGDAHFMQHDRTHGF